MALYQVIVLIISMFALIVVYFTATIELRAIVNSTETYVDNPRVDNFYANLQSMWGAIPYVVIIGVFSWVIIYTLRRERRDEFI